MNSFKGHRVTLGLMVGVLFAAYSASAVLSAKSYIADGLVGHWDGVSNVSLDGGHDPNATQWSDLSGKGPAIPVPANAVFQANGLQTARGNGSIPDATASAAILNAVGATKYTVEIAYDMTAGSTSATANSRMLTLGNDDYWIGASGSSSELGISPVYNAWGGGLTRTTAVRPDATGAHSFSCLQNGAEVWVRIDGTNVHGWGMSDAQGIRAFNHGFRFNRGYYENVGLDGVYHSIRIYDRCLTDDEKAINLAVDRVRFFGWDPESIELPDGWRFNTEDGVKLEGIRQVSVVEPGFGRVSVDGGEAASSVAVWIDQSAPTRLRVSAVPAEGYKFKKWIGNVDPADVTVQDGVISVTGDVQAKFSKISGVLLIVR